MAWLPVTFSFFIIMYIHCYEPCLLPLHSPTSAR